MASVINGTNIVLYKYNPSTSLSVAFGSATTCTFQSSTDQVELTTKSTGIYREFLSSQLTWTVSCDGFICLDSDYNYLAMMYAQQNNEQITIKFSIDNDNGTMGTLGRSVFTGVANITSISYTGAVESASTYSISLQGTGAYTISGTVPTETGIVISSSNVQMYNYVATGAEGTSITFTGAIGSTCISVSRGGVEVRAIGTTGTPSGEDVVFNSSTGVLTFARALEVDEYIRAIFK